MAKLTKAQARKRLEEARRKVHMVVWNGSHYLTPADLKKLQTLMADLHKAQHLNSLK